MGKQLYFGGPILTMDRSNPRVEAMLTEDGKILAVGNYEDLCAVSAERMDLRGRTLLPGFVDGHSHMIGVGKDLASNCSLTGCTGFEDLLERIRRFRQEKDLTHREPIYCRGYDPAIMREESHPTAALLDSLGFDNPIACIHQSGHVAAYNTVAMEMAGVLTADYRCPEGGYAGRDDAGKLNGYFEEAAKAPFNRLFREKTDEASLERYILQAQEAYIQNGYTTVQEGSANTSLERLACLERLGREGKLKVDVVYYLTSDPKQEALWQSVLEDRGPGYRNRVKIGGMKMFLDGSPQARTAWMTEPYEGEPEYRGYPMLTDDQVEQRLRKALEWGLQPIAHCNGDAASEQFLKAWETVTVGEGKQTGLRPVMVHAQTVRYDQLDRMARVGMMPSFFVGHCWYWGDTHLRNFGSRGMRISPVGQALGRNMTFSFHQDCPVTPPDMLHSVWCAVNRITRSGICVGPENRISCYDALVAATAGGAYTYFEEETKGILKPGAAADFAVLSADPTAVKPMQIRDIRVLATIKAGEVIYTAETEG